MNILILLRILFQVRSTFYIREKRIFRSPKIISETNCIVQIYGLGINGRLFSEGSSTGKLLILEAYSIWNSTKYFTVLTMLQLRQLFSHRPDLLKPGAKAKLMKEIVDLMYFDYTITIVPYLDDLDLGLENGTQTKPKNERIRMAFLFSLSCQG